MDDHLKLLAEIRSADPATPAPTRAQLTRHLETRIAAVGVAAFAEFAYLHKCATDIWGAVGTAHLGGGPQAGPGNGKSTAQINMD